MYQWQLISMKKNLWWLTIQASMLACSSGASRQFETYLVDEDWINLAVNKMEYYVVDKIYSTSTKYTWQHQHFQWILLFNQAFVNDILSCPSLRVQWTCVKRSNLSCIVYYLFLHSISYLLYLASLDSWVLANATCFNFSIFRRIVGFCSWMLNTGSCNKNILSSRHFSYLQLWFDCFAIRLLGYAHG